MIFTPVDAQLPRPATRALPGPPLKDGEKAVKLVGGLIKNRVEVTESLAELKPGVRNPGIAYSHGSAPPSSSWSLWRAR